MKYSIIFLFLFLALNLNSQNYQPDWESLVAYVFKVSGLNF